MSISTTILNIVVGRAGSALTFPAGYLSSFSQSISGNAGSSALALDSIVQSGQKSINNTFSNIPTATNQDIGIAQFVSFPFTGITSISAANWTINFAATLSNAAANFTWKGRAALYLVNGTGVSAGTIKTTIFALTDIGSTGRSSTAELTCFSSAISGSAATSATNDYLALEIGLNVNNTSGGNLAPNITLYADGITTTASDATTVSNHNSRITSPTSLVLSPVVMRSQLPVGLELQYHGPGASRVQTAAAPSNQMRGPGASRAQIAVPTVLFSRNSDVSIYRMRGFDANAAVNRVVYWVASKVDTTASQYTGSAGPVSDIIVAAVIET